MKILVKFPTRSRPDRFVSVIKKYVELSTNPSQIHYLISVDEDDRTMDGVIDRIKFIPKENLTWVVGRSRNKIEAINRDIEQVKEWDIIVSAADDMSCISKAWDERIRGDMEHYYPKLDGCLWYSDGHQERTCTMSVMGRKAYNKKGLYHPSYKSVYCDVEFTDYWKSEDKLTYFHSVLFRHDHAGFTRIDSDGRPIVRDELFMRNESKELYTIDRENYEKRKALNWKL